MTLSNITLLNTTALIARTNSTVNFGAVYTPAVSSFDLNSTPWGDINLGNSSSFKNLTLTNSLEPSPHR